MKLGYEQEQPRKRIKNWFLFLSSTIRLRVDRDVDRVLIMGRLRCQLLVSINTRSWVSIVHMIPCSYMHNFLTCSTDYQTSHVCRNKIIYLIPSWKFYDSFSGVLVECHSHICWVLGDMSTITTCRDRHSTDTRITWYIDCYLTNTQSTLDRMSANQ